MSLSIPDQRDSLSAVEWRPWPQDPRYRVGSDGTILGVWGGPLKDTISAKWGYCIMVVRLTSGRRLCTTRHRIVCETFHGPCPPGHEAAHLNGIHTDCRAENLEWKTPEGNMADRVPHGTNGMKLTAEEVQQIRLRAGESRTGLAREFGVSVAAIQQIHVGRTWQHLPWPDGTAPTPRQEAPQAIANLGSPPAGEAHHRAILDEEAVRDIRKQHADGRRGVISQMARKYDVTPATIRCAVQRKTWKHVD